MLDGAVSTVRTAFELHDGAAMDAALTTLTATRNACHQAERVPFVHVQPPSMRIFACWTAPRQMRESSDEYHQAHHIDFNPD